MYFHQMLILKSYYYYYGDYKMLELREGNSRNLEVCTLKEREDNIVVTQY